MKKGDLIKFAVTEDGNTTKFIFKVASLEGQDEQGRDIVIVDNGIAFFIPKEEECPVCDTVEDETPPFDLVCLDDDSKIPFEPDWLPVKEHFRNQFRTFENRILVNTYQFASIKDFDLYDDVVGYHSKNI